MTARKLTWLLPAATTQAAAAIGLKGDKGDAGTTEWAGLSGKPATFPPSAHGHAIADVVDLQAALDGKETAGAAAAAAVAHSAAADPHPQYLTADEAAATLPIVNLLEDGGRFAGSPEAQNVSAGAYANPAYLDLINGASRVAGPKRIHDSSTYGGPNAAMDPLVVALLERLKASSVRRLGVEWHTMQVTVGTGTTNALTVAGAPHYAPFFWDPAPLPAVCSLNYHFRVLSGSVAINGPSGDTPYLDGSPLAAAQAFTSADGWKQVTRLRNKDPYSFVDYDLRMEQLYGTPGTVFLFALPLLFPGHLPMAPGKFYGPTPSFRAWR